MSKILPGILRDKVGTRPSRRLRAEGRIPASLQADSAGAHIDLSINERQFMDLRRHHEHVFVLEIGGAQHPTIVRELEWDIFGDHIRHVEFRRVDLTQTTDAEVEIAFIGQPKTGLLNHLVTHLTIRALPEAIPDSLEIDVSEMHEGDDVFASQLKLPEGVELLAKADLLVAHVAVPRALEPDPVLEVAPEAVTPVEPEEPDKD